MKILTLLVVVLAAVSLVPAGLRAQVKGSEVRFADGDIQLGGTVYRPQSGKACAAVVILGGGDRSARGPLKIGIAKHFAAHGVAALVYDSPGTGASAGNALLQSRDDRAREAVSAARYLRSLSDVPARAVGVFGGSEGADIAVMAAASDADIAFVIAVSGAFGGSTIDIMRYAAEKKGYDRGLGADDIAKAVTFKEIAFAFLSGLDIVEWPLIEARARGWQNAAWEKFIDMARQRQEGIPEGHRQKILADLRQVVDAFKAERWFEIVDVGNAVQRLVAMDADRFFLLLEKRPFGRDWHTDLSQTVAQVHCPVLGIWGEEDSFLPPRQSAARLEKFLLESNHRDHELIVFEDASHTLTVSDATPEFVPGYLDTMTNWLAERFDFSGCSPR